MAVKGDTTVESAETFFVNLSNVTGATLADASGQGTIGNDDVAPPPPPAPAVSVITDPCDSTRTALKITGTPNADTIAVTQVGGSQSKAAVKINNVNLGTFNFTGRIYIYGLAGSDNISIQSAITRTAFIFGGEGKDTVCSGAGADVIVGGAGDDSLKGNAGRDIIVGGNDGDKLDGGADDDLLVAGETNYDANLSALCMLNKEWTRTDKTYAQRTSNIRNGGGYNGSTKLNASTVYSAPVPKDTLTGGSGNDLFFAAVPGDLVTDKASGEALVDVG